MFGDLKRAGGSPDLNVTFSSAVRDADAQSEMQLFVTGFPRGRRHAGSLQEADA